MDLVSKIEISIKSMNSLNQYKIDLKNNIIEINNEKLIIDNFNIKQWIENFIRIIRNWEYEQISNDVKDGVNTKINIYEMNRIYSYFINNDLPSNYDSFILLINELEGLK